MANVTLKDDVCHEEEAVFESTDCGGIEAVAGRECPAEEASSQVKFNRPFCRMSPQKVGMPALKREGWQLVRIRW